MPIPTGPPKPTLNGLPAPSLVNTQPKEYEASIEATYFLAGLMGEFTRQCAHYKQLTGQMAALGARLDLAEKTVSLTRDHLKAMIEQTDTVTPTDWDTVFQTVRFVGLRLVDACVALLKEHKRMSSKDLVQALNHGMFRFRTNAPLRETHAALLRHPSIRKEGDDWIWSDDAETDVTQVNKETALQSGR